MCAFERSEKGMDFFMEAERIYVQHGGDLEEFLHRIEEENNP